MLNDGESVADEAVYFAVDPKNEDDGSCKSSEVNHSRGAQLPWWSSPLRGLKDDMKRRYNLESCLFDWTAIVTHPLKIVSSTCFIFCAVLCPAITFAQYLKKTTHSTIGEIVHILSH